MPNSTGPPMPRPPPPKHIQCSMDTLPENYGHVAFEIIILLVTLYGNFMVVLAVVMFRRMRTITNYFVVSLAVSDLLVATLSLPFRIHQTTHNTAWCLSLEACVAWIVVDIMCAGASIWNLVIISIDRFIAIVLPFRYHALMTPISGFGLIASVWGLSFVMAVLSFINWTDYGKPHFNIFISCANFDPIYYTVLSVVLFFLPLFIVFVMYGHVFTVALTQARAVAALQTDRQATTDGGRRGYINFLKEVKAAKVLAIVVGCFVVCWFPYFVLVLVSLWDPILLSRDTISPEQAKGINQTFVSALPVLNSTLNPIIYALFNKDFRRSFAKIFAQFCRRRVGSDDGNNLPTL
ncbi:predicted protein [Nematostella vectensis]|uniref:G-protein coupled receptors family 1 profile domain-containing protein n=1 Tax=Nematostella vectensis TaxID=45351 RepID=A7SI86_NEMVE|nr:predicted protein [Nematostella vectensis]|eukprot:XP_001628672.1 predicted protein [Nematostella vectensis]